jgi:S1-C subfamily serine protease
MVEGADEVKVGFADEEPRVRAKVVGTDPATDIAVIKVVRKDLPALTVEVKISTKGVEMKLRRQQPTRTRSFDSGRPRGLVSLPGFEPHSQ